MTPSLTSLYQNYRSSLSDDRLVMQDDILGILIQIEREVGALLDSTELDGSRKPDEKRENRYKTKDNIFHAQIAKEAQMMKRKVGRGLSIQHMLGQISRRQNHVRNILKDESYEEVCQRLGIHYTRHTDGATRPFVPTQSGQAPITGSGTGWESSEKRAPKFLEFIGLLKDIKTPEGGYIDPRDITVDFQTETPDKMMRTIPYIVIRIPRLSRTILIDDRIGEATFVLQGIIDLDIIRTEVMKGLETYQGARKVPYNQKWGENLLKYLQTNWSPDESHGESGTKNTPTLRIAIDRASLFMDASTIRTNLEAFAHAGGVRVEALSTTVPKWSTEVELSNGVKMRWNRFLINASQYLLGTKWNDKENPHKLAEALDQMLEMMGVVRIDKEYFQNTEYIEKDLQEFAREGGVMVEALSTTTPTQSTEVTLSNGVDMTWGAFLRNASKYLLGTKWNDKENPHKLAEALDKMLEMVGVVRIDKEYFQNTEYIEKDLQEFAHAGGVHIAELSTGTPTESTKVKLSNGVTMTWNRFLINASQYLLGTKWNDTKNSHKPVEALDQMLEMMGVVRIDKEYFQNTEYIEKDLKAFALTGGVMVEALSTGTPTRSTEVKLSNGVTMRWTTFLMNASQYLLGTSNDQKLGKPHKLAEALDRMFGMVGVVRKVRVKSGQP